MKVYLAGVESYPYLLEVYKNEKPFILSSFFYMKDDLLRTLPYCGDFLLDSGAFTFMQGGGNGINIDDYTERYAEFINRNRIDKFFEMDIDSIAGYEKVKDLRRKLERLTGKQPIPVWHKSRGQEEYERCCQEYPYVAIGGLVDGAVKGEYAQKFWKYFPWFIRTAHKHKSKIHALGFTSIEGINKYHFDSVDSTRWNCARFGRYEFFNGHGISVYDWRKDHKRLKPEEAKTMAIKNFGEWIKFQKYAEKHL